jgi:hypothetical protein
LLTLWPIFLPLYQVLTCGRFTNLYSTHLPSVFSLLTTSRWLDLRKRIICSISLSRAIVHSWHTIMPSYKDRKYVPIPHDVTRNCFITLQGWFKQSCVSGALIFCIIFKCLSWESRDLQIQNHVSITSIQWVVKLGYDLWQLIILWDLVNSVWFINH